jgi:RNA recognition motif-containing protein
MKGAYKMVVVPLCRLAAAAQNLMKKEGPRNLYVGSLHYHITEPMLKKIFEPFGYVEKLNIQRDENGLSKGYGFIEVSGGLIVRLDQTIIVDGPHVQPVNQWI